MNIKDIAIGQRVARFAAPPSAVPRRGAAPPDSEAGAANAQRVPVPAVSAPAPRSEAPTFSPPPSFTPAVDNAPAAVDASAALDAARAATEKTVQDLEARRLENTRADVRVHVDEATQRIVAEVLNNQQEVIRQLPPEELLRIAARLDDVVGLIFDRRV